MKAKKKSTTISKEKKDKRIKHGKYVGRERNTEWSEKTLPPAIPDPEDEETIDDDPLLDGLAEHFKEWPSGKHPYVQYPPPKKNYIFRKRWKEFIEILVAKPNFKMAYLNQLEILCDLYQDYERLSKFIRTRGHSYEANGRQGKQIKLYPEVELRKHVMVEIRNVTKQLGLDIGSDDTPGTGGSGSGQDKDEWT